jgi:hypothetical protein
MPTRSHTGFPESLTPATAAAGAMAAGASGSAAGVGVTGVGLAGAAETALAATGLADTAAGTPLFGDGAGGWAGAAAGDTGALGRKRAWSASASITESLARYCSVCRYVAHVLVADLASWTMASISSAPSAAALSAWKHVSMQAEICRGAITASPSRWRASHRVDTREFLLQLHNLFNQNTEIIMSIHIP